MTNEERLIDANALSEAVSGIGKDMKRPRAVELACLCLIAEAPTVDAVKVIRCKECRFWMAEAKERCEKLGTQPFGWCLKDRNLDEMDWREHRYQHDFCSRGKKKRDERR